MSAALVTTFTFNSDAVDSICAELSAALPELAERFPQAVDRLVDLVEAGAELFALEFDDAPAAGAGELRMVAKPSHGLIVLMTAIRSRADNAQLVLIEQALGHLASPSVSSKPPMMTAPPPDEQSGGGAVSTIV